MSRSFRIVATAAVLVFALGSSTASARGTETVTLSLQMATTVQAAMEAMIANFERVYPDIKIKATYQPSNTLVVLTLTQLQAGNAPDLFYLRPGTASPNSVWPLAADNRLLDLSASPWVKRMGPTPELSSYKGKVYSWPMAFIPDVAVYNVDLFKQLGVTVPKTFSQVLAFCKKVTAAGKVPFVQAFGDSTAGQIVGRPLYEETVYGPNPNWTADRAAGKVTFSGSPGWRLALQRLVDMKEAGCFQPGATGTSRSQQYAMFANGQAAVSMIATSEMPSILLANPKIKTEYFNMPFAYNPATAAIAAPPSIMLAGNKATRYPAQVRTFINFVARVKQSSLFARLAGSIAPFDVKKAIVPPEMKELIPYLKAGKVRAGDESGWANPAVFQSTFVPGIIGLMTGQSTVDGILKAMDDAWDHPTG